LYGYFVLTKEMPELAQIRLGEMPRRRLGNMGQSTTRFFLSCALLFSMGICDPAAVPSFTTGVLRTK